MNKAMIVHHTLNILLMIILIIVNFFNTLNLPVSITLATLILVNAILLIRANSKQVKNNGITIDDYKKK
ncbi:hypothetical protein [Staphylococcus nepalensis]|jgi:hypothetical protein|uniref:Uncharacterized protein n=2 Tax=Staphylococcus nepalensis TaxID=214473 RepID=A0A291JNJ3_9STAP|nr:hypothetical protein [Staphylococcus nepalensis]VDG68173.1 Uncharacterised protein [Lacrimispora indolis]ATH61145.1 hypothetical protein BJD96_13035 [Staphylococcus nepalensis]ATH66176.1 hypothetical protein BJG89_13045 [Staphylococcus nepalensis]AWI45565.1 hypothetical protein BJG88_12925 [Staphylococcus nepalensis]MBO1205939.1 hypothetical protein [Staphylococcus nepalensis]